MTAGEQPQIHSNAGALGDGRLTAPSAMRNIGPILAAMRDFVPGQGRALEIASGTGQHIVEYAQAFPGVEWQPTDIAPDRLASVDAWVVSSGCANVSKAQMLDAGVSGWDAGRYDYVSVCNLFHLISDAAARHVLTGAAKALSPGGVLFIYGPYRKEDVFRSQGDADFHARIQADNPAAGYKSVEWMQAGAGGAGLTFEAEIEMPANNLSLIWRK